MCLITNVYSQDMMIPDSYLWKNRIILIFSDSSQKVSRKQLKTFASEHQEMLERELIVFNVGEGKVYQSQEVVATTGEADYLHNRYQVPKNQFRVILIGKDGGEKLRQDTLLSTDKLFAIIDAMPMRRQEIRKRRGDG